MLPRIPTLVAMLCAAFALRAQSLGVVDQSFRAAEYTQNIVDATFKPTLNAEPELLLPLPDGRTLIAGRSLSLQVGSKTLTGLARLKTDGSVDPTFVPERGLEVDAAVMTAVFGDAVQASFWWSWGPPALAVQPDGRIVAFQGFKDRFNFGGATLSYVAIARYNPDGTRDSSFRPSPKLRSSLNLPLMLADGRWLTLKSTADAAGYRIVQLTRFDADGNEDTKFGEQTLVTASKVGVTSYWAQADPWNKIGARTIDSAGRWHLVASAGLTVYDPRVFERFSLTSADSWLFRLNSDGTPDATFAPNKIGQLRMIGATTRGLICFEFSAFAGSARPTSSLYRLKPDGEEDSAFGRTTITAYSSEFDLVETGPDGSVYALARDNPGLGVGGNPPGFGQGIVRIDPQGSLDSEFVAALGAAVNSITTFKVMPDGKPLIGGSFVSIAGSAQNYLARLAPATRTRLVNLSILADTGAAENTLIAGFITKGSDASILVRAAGPALKPFGVADALIDPRLSIYSGTAAIAGNDNWEPALATTFARASAFPFQPGSRDSALLITIPTGSVTAHVTSVDGSSGTALFEAYDAGPQLVGVNSPRLINLAARVRLGSKSTATVGFILQGDKTATLLIRAIGPGLGQFGISNYAVDPVLTVMSGQTAIARNDNWEDGPAADVAQRRSAAAAAAAFPLSNGSKDAALVITLPAAAYTLQVTGQNADAGAVLIEIYELP